jgi:PIN domain nuclease of toxin-antitoxin system
MTAIGDPENEVAVSAASIWEAEIKRIAGKLSIDNEPADEVERSGFLPLSVTFEDAIGAARLPPHHRDPFDRILIAQAQRHGMTLVTRDRRMADYGIAILSA